MNGESEKVYYTIFESRLVFNLFFEILLKNIYGNRMHLKHFLCILKIQLQSFKKKKNENA